MNLLVTVDTIHWAFAFLLLLCALLFGWVQMGRRVMVALIGIQVLIGVVFAGLIGRPPMLIIWHILFALLAMGAYIAGRRLGAGSKSRVIPMLFSLLGLLLLVLTAYVGLKMHGRIA